MTRWMVLQTWHISALLMALGISAMLFAWSTFNLYGVAVANLSFIGKYGAMALMDGGFMQLLEISAYGFVSMLLFLLFKGCETEIMARWRGLHAGEPPGAD